MSRNHCNEKGVGRRTEEMLVARVTRSRLAGGRTPKRERVALAMQGLPPRRLTTRDDSVVGYSETISPRYQARRRTAAYSPWWAPM